METRAIYVRIKNDYRVYYSVNNKCKICKFHVALKTVDLWQGLTHVRCIQYFRKINLLLKMFPVLPRSAQHANENKKYIMLNLELFGN